MQEIDLEKPRDIFIATIAATLSIPIIQECLARRNALLPLSPVEIAEFRRSAVDHWMTMNRHLQKALLETDQATGESH